MLRISFTQNVVQIVLQHVKTYHQLTIHKHAKQAVTATLELY